MGLRQGIERLEMTRRINNNRNQAIKQMKRTASELVKEIVMLRWQVCCPEEEVRYVIPIPPTKMMQKRVMPFTMPHASMRYDRERVKEERRRRRSWDVMQQSVQTTKTQKIHTSKSW